MDFFMLQNQRNHCLQLQFCKHLFHLFLISVLLMITRAHSTIARRHYWTWSHYCGHKVKLLTKNVKDDNKSAILNFFPAIIEVVQELVISNMHNRFEDDILKTFQVIAPTRSNYWRKMRKIAINRPFWIFFQPLLNLSKNYLLVTCITSLKRICEKLFKLSRPQGQIIDVKWEKSQ